MKITHISILIKLFKTGQFLDPYGTEHCLNYLILTETNT